jgi:osmotically-inducible protein OsmY
MSKNDAELQQAVLDELRWDPRVNAAHIGITALAGVVTLTGDVESYAEKHAAGIAAGRVPGVRGLADKLVVRLPVESERSDADIAAAALGRLFWDVIVPPDRVQVEVEDGWVTLTGELAGHHQREAAEADIRSLHGVVGVSKRLTLKAKVDTANLSDDITYALHRFWMFNSQNIGVRAEGGRITLSGTVHSWADRQKCADTAWAAPGATNVQNDIVVTLLPGDASGVRAEGHLAAE